MDFVGSRLLSLDIFQDFGVLVSHLLFCFFRCFSVVFNLLSLSGLFYPIFKEIIYFLGLVLRLV